jgi:branched-chain amino acid transport system ATP-binding protein
LTVEDNLRLGAWTTQRRDHAGDELDRVYGLFPVLADRRRQQAQTMSGGQQQMLAIGRALMARPRFLMLDEPSTGLSPKLTWEVLAAVSAIRDSGVAVLLVEQNASQALAIADRAYVLESGSVVLEGAGKELAGDERVKKAYLGL